MKKAILEAGGKAWSDFYNRWSNREELYATSFISNEISTTLNYI